VKSHWHALAFGLLAILGSCVPSSEKLVEGEWRGLLKANGNEIPFNFSLKYSDSQPVLTYRNAAEEFVADEAVISGDSIIFPVEVYDAKLVVFSENKRLRGYWVRDSNSDRKITFEAHPNETYRFWHEE